MTTPYRIVLCTWPADRPAEPVAERLVAAGLAACVNILPGVTSVYRWEGVVEHGQEQLLMIKTSAAAYPRLEAALRDAHPYELPEIVAVGIEQGSSAYLDWMESCLR